MKRQKITLFILILLTFYIKIEAKGKFVQANKFTQCKDFPNLLVDFSKLVATNFRSGVKLTGSFEVKKDFSGDIDLQLDCHRCTPEGRQYVPFTNNTVKNICIDFKNNLFFGDKLGKITEPPIKCFPFKAGTYVVSEFLFDGSSITYLPIEGHRWANRILFFIGGKPINNKNLVGCLDTEVTVMTKRVRG